MFGYYRTFLAAVVLMHHLFRLPVAGQYAVHGFFVLSGYLMTRVMHESYGYTAQGRWTFILNRTLRLYPSYAAVICIASLIVIFVGADAALTFRKHIALPTTLNDWIANLTMVYPSFYPNSVSPRLSPATWALTLELFYYALICLGASKNALITWGWLALGLAFHLYGIALGYDLDYRYLHLFSGSLPFSIGALIFFYQQRLPAFKMDTRRAATVGVVVLLILSGAAQLAKKWFGFAGEVSFFYLNIATSAATVMLLIQASGDRQRDTKAGEFSYHIYILHWPLGLFIFTQLFHLEQPSRTVSGFLAAAATLLVSIACSAALTRFIDRPVEALRDHLRTSSPRSNDDNAALPAAA